VILLGFILFLGVVISGIFIYALRPDKPPKAGEWYSSI
jgi:hypothetical protein